LTANIQLAKASRPVDGKGEDCVFCFRFASSDTFLIGVADGISQANGGEAARWIEQAMLSISDEHGTEAMGIRQLFGRFQELLRAESNSKRYSDSSSTLSCGIGRLEKSGNANYIRFDFFGIGDSPIWRITSSSIGGLTFQASPVYSPPVPSEQGNVYSSVNLRSGKIDGQIHFGSVQINEGELLVVATDGLPEFRVLYDDQDPDRCGPSPRLIERLLRSDFFDDQTLVDSIADYDKHRLLIDDDASLVVARLDITPEVIPERLSDFEQSEWTPSSTYQMNTLLSACESSDSPQRAANTSSELPLGSSQSQLDAGPHDLTSPLEGESQNVGHSAERQTLNLPGLSAASDKLTMPIVADNLPKRRSRRPKTKPNK
jgi:serine/threonine protein phosphatase PrpC